MPPPRTPAVAQLLVDAYITGLRQRLPTLCLQQLDKVPAANEAQLHHLCQAYPNAPIELIYLLQRFNGSNWERHSGSNNNNNNTTSSNNVTTAAERASKTAASQQQPPAANTGSTPTHQPPTTHTSTTTTTTTSATTTTTASNNTTSKVTTTAAKFLKNTLVGKPPKKSVPSIAGSGPLPGLYAKREKTAVPVLGSALESCPYFLRSVDQILGPHRFLAPRAADFTAMTTSSSSSNSSSNSASNNSKPVAAAASPRATGNSANKAALQAREWSEPRNLKTLYADHDVVSPGPSVPAAEATPAPTAPASQATKEEEAHKTIQAVLKMAKPAVLVDPRIDMQADLSNWLEFAESIHFELLPQAPAQATPPPPPASPITQSVAARENKGAADAQAATQAASEKAQADAVHGSSDATTTQKYIESHLFVDFKPAEGRGGVVGQVVQYVRNSPDSFTVIAENFGDYLKHLIAEEYQFTEILEDDDDDDEEEEEETKKAVKGTKDGSSKDNKLIDTKAEAAGTSAAAARDRQRASQNEAAKP